MKCSACLAYQVMQRYVFQHSNVHGHAANTTRGGDNADEVSDRAGRWSIALNNLLNLIQN